MKKLIRRWLGIQDQALIAPDKEWRWQYQDTMARYECLQHSIQDMLSESFLDEIVDRINRKQLKRK